MHHSFEWEAEGLELSTPPGEWQEYLISYLKSNVAGTKALQGSIRIGLFGGS